MIRVGPAQRNGIGIGLGLFAKKAITEGTIVVKMNKDKETRMSETAWQRYWRENNRLHDSAVFVNSIGKSGLRVTDWLSGPTPRWYRLNHSFNPNTEMKYRKGRVVWIATKNIAVGEEITFDYGEVPDEWN